MQQSSLTYPTLPEWVGREIGLSDWVIIDQPRIDQFAACTGDRQWIHIDPERARKESPFRSTIAHGCLTLSIVAALAQEIGAIPQNTMAAFNQGFEQVRFVAPVVAGSRIRLRCLLVGVEQVGPGQYLMRAENTIEIEGGTRPALVAESLVMCYERREKRRRTAGSATPA
jgi:acyl dehydratase